MSSIEPFHEHEVLANKRRHGREDKHRIAELMNEMFGEREKDDDDGMEYSHPRDERNERLNGDR